MSYLDSLERTAQLDLVELLPGHGPPVLDHRGLIAERIELHRIRKERMYQQLRERPLTAQELAHAIWGDIALQQVYLTLSDRSFFDLLSFSPAAVRPGAPGRRVQRCELQDVADVGGQPDYSR